jgi:hypothetical protein
MTRLRLGVLSILVAVVLLAGNSLIGGKGDRPRECGSGVKARVIVAIARWSSGSVKILGHIGPQSISQSRVDVSPHKATGQACPGETVSIDVHVIGGPVTSITCDLTTGGANITGDAIVRDRVAGKRAACRAVVS